MHPEKRKRILPTVEFYDVWSSTYDFDGNVLQMVDDRVFQQLAEPLLDSNIENQTETNVVCDLGCGTGRNTLKVFNRGYSIVSSLFLVSSNLHSAFRNSNHRLVDLALIYLR